MTTRNDLNVLTAKNEERKRIKDLATEGPWEVGGPYPSVSVIVMIDAGQGWPEPEPPVYDAICILDPRTSGEPTVRDLNNAAFIAFARNDCAEKTIASLIEEMEGLRAAIAAHRATKADDRCIEDDDRLYETLGDGIKCDRRVGDKNAMLANCKRFIENRCEGGGWKSYADLEAEHARLAKAYDIQMRRGWHASARFPNDIMIWQVCAMDCGFGGLKSDWWPGSHFE